MARRTLNRRELRIANEAAEATDTAAVEDDDGSEAKAPVKKPAKKRKSRAKADKIVRYKAFWGVFNQSLRRVALYEFNERKQADKKAEELTKSGKSPHFVQPVKEQIVD